MKHLPVNVLFDQKNYICKDEAEELELSDIGFSFFYETLRNDVLGKFQISKCCIKLNGQTYALLKRCECF